MIDSVTGAGRACVATTSGRRLGHGWVWEGGGTGGGGKIVVHTRTISRFALLLHLLLIIFFVSLSFDKLADRVKRSLVAGLNFGIAIGPV